MRYLMISTYPPTHCGIGAYGEQHVTQLRGEGHVVDVASPDGQGNVDFALDLRGGGKVLRLQQLLPFYDRVGIQYVWAFFYTDPFLRQHRWDTLRTTLAFMWLFLRNRKIEVIAHEIPYLSGKQGWLYKWKWRLAPKIIFHTRTELERFERHYRLRLRKSQVELRTHHDVFQKFAATTQASARRQLGVPQDVLVFLCIGFIQRHKGFHRAIRAFLQAGIRDAELYVVGSMRVPDGENQKYLAEVKQLVAGQSAVQLKESFVSNEDFDTWITAADWVVLPYSEIWSSGVLARTRLMQRPAIVSAIGGLPEQAGENDLLFHTDEELLSAFQTAASRNRRNRVPSSGASGVEQR